MVVHPYKGIQFRNESKQTIVVCNYMNDSHNNHSKWKKPDQKRLMFYDSVM